ncbi:MAG TPA: transposase [Phycisphaerae bacterium]|jgi:putative transposase
MEEEDHYKTCKRYNVSGHSHFLTFSCFKRQPFLSKDRTCQWLAKTIISARRDFNFRVIAYVFMPEHVHLLLYPNDKIYNISDILSAIKTPVTRAAKKFVTESARDFLPRMLDVQPSGEKGISFLAAWRRL